jgi:hypothetical protein
MRAIYRISLLSLLVVLPVGAAIGQSDDMPDPGQVALKLSDAMKANTKNLVRYTWKNAIEVIKEGDTVSKTVNQVRIGSDGKPEMTLVSQEPEEEEKRGLRGKKQAKEHAYIQSVVKLGTAYSMPATGDLVEFFERSTFALGAGNMDGYVQVQGKGLVQEGDEVTMWIHGTTFQPHKTEFRTTLDGDPVTGTLTYGYVSEEGPFYVAEQIATVDAKKLKTVTKNTDVAVAE